MYRCLPNGAQKDTASTIDAIAIHAASLSLSLSLSCASYAQPSSSYLSRASMHGSLQRHAIRDLYGARRRYNRANVGA